MIHVRADLFRAVNMARSYDATRYYLGGVYVEPCSRGGAVLTASDGHILISAWDSVGVCEAPAIVQLDKTRLAACKSPPRREDRFVTVSSDGMAKIVGAGDDPTLYEQQHSVIVEGTFPDWRRVVPRGPFGPTSEAFNPGLLGRIGDAYCVICDCKTAALRVLASLEDPIGGHYVPINDIAFAAVFPIRRSHVADIPTAVLDFATVRA